MLIWSLFLCSTAFAVDGYLLWQYGDAQSGKQEARASAVDSQGNVIITGYRNVTGNDDYWTVKFNADGSGIAWRASFDKAGGGDQATAVVVDHNNDVIVTGYAWNGSNRDIHTIKYSGSDGTVLWQHTYNGVAGGNDLATAIAVDSQNNVYVGGSSQGASGTDDYVILRYDATGPVGNAPAWQASYNGPANNMDDLYGLAVGTDGLAVTGQSYNGTAFDLLTVKYDLNGTKLWEVRYTSAGGAMGKKVRLDAADNVIITGFAADATSKNIYTAKYNAADGNLLWERSRSTSFDEEGNDLYVDNSGEVFVTGYAYTVNGTKKRAYTARYGGTTGAVVWESLTNMASDSDEGTGIIVDSAGDAYITGLTITSSNYDIMTIKYQRATGTELWNHRFNGAMNLNDRAVGMGLAIDGGILVAGWSDSGATGFDYYAFKLDPQYLSAPSNLGATTLSNSSIRLTWTDNAGNELGYKIERKIGETGTYAQVAQISTPNTTTYDDLGLSGNLTYYYRVRAYNVANGDSRYSNEAHALTVYFSNVSPAWTYLYNGGDNLNDKINALAVGPDNNPVVAGYSQKTSGGHDYLTVKLDRSTKNVLWSQPYDDPNGGTDEAMCVAVDSGNNTVVSGFATLYNSQTHSDIFSIYTLMYSYIDPSSVAWDSQYNGPANIDDRPVAIASATDTSNNTVVVGYGRNAANNTDIYLIKYNSASGKVWSATPFDGPGHGNDIPSAAAFAPDGSIYVTGYSEKAAGSGTYNLFTAKYDPSGSLIWSDIYSVVPSGDNRGNALAVDSLGDVYVTGTATNGAANKDIYTIKYSGSATTAQRLWERALDGQAHGDDTGTAIGVDAIEGTIVAAGTALTASGNNDLTLIKYTSAGDVVWQQTLLRPNNDDTLKGMAIDPSGTIYLTGDTSNGASVDILSAIIDPSGAVLATSVYNGPGNDADEASTIVANEKGEAFVAGYSTNTAGNMDYLVLKLLSSSYIVVIPTHLAAAPQADSGKMALSWTNNYPGAGYYLERTIGPATAGSSWTLVNTTGAGATSYMDTGLNPMTNYCYRIEAFSGSATSRKTLPVCATTTTAQPVLNLPARVSATAVDLSWSNVTGNTGYKLERSSDNATWAQIGGNLAADTAIYHDTGLNQVLSYCYRVTSLSDSGASLASTVQIVPALSATSSTTSSITLAWPALAGITGFKLERSADGTSGWSQIAAPAQSVTTFTDTGLSTGATYYYRIKAVTTSGDSIPSTAIPFTTLPASPVLNTVTAVSSSQIDLSWSAAVGATGYEVWESSCDNRWTTWNGYYTYNPFVWHPVSTSSTNCDSYPQYIGWTTATKAATTGGATNASRSGLSGGTYYSYYVVATTASSASAPSNALKAWTPVAPSALTATTITDTSVALGWTYTKGWTGSTLERSPDGVSSWTTIKSNSGSANAYNSTTYTDSGLSPATTYYYRVTVTGVVAPTAVSSVLAVTTKPPGPAITSVTLSGGQISVAWDSLADVAGYEVQLKYSTDSSANPGYYNQTGQPVSVATNSYLLTSPNAGWAYKFQVRGKYADGSYTGWGSDSGLWKRLAPPAPTSIYASSTSVSWYTSAGTTSYTLQSMQPSGSDCSAGSAWTTLTTTATTSYSPIPSSSLAAYCFKVSASNESGTSAYSTPAIYLPPPATFTLGSATVSSIPLSWSNVPGNNGYTIEGYWNNNYYYWNGGSYVYGTQWVTITNTAKDATSLNLTGLMSNTNYQYRISTRFSGGTSITKLSGPASATTLTLGNMVLSSLTVDSYSQITLNWSDVSGNNGYKIQRSPDNAAWSDLVTTAPGATSYSDTTVTSGTKYYYRGQAKDGAGNVTAVSNVLSGTTPLTTPALSSVIAVSEAGIDLRWQVVPSATNYKLSRSVGPGGPWTQIANPAISYTTNYCGSSMANPDCLTPIAAYTSYSDSGLLEGTNYCYQVKAWNTAIGDSAPSTTICATTFSLGGPNLTSVTTVPSKRSIQLAWSYNPGACSPNPCTAAPDGFEVWRQAWNGEWVLLSKTANSDLSFIDRINIEPQKQYSYKIRAFQGTNTSVFSNVNGVTTPQFGLTDNTCP